MAGVSRAAVSNWRKRSPDFPTSVGGTEAKPLFDRVAVTAWLHRRGYELAHDHGDIEIFGLFNTFRGRIRIESMTALLMSMLCARKLSTETAGSNRAWEQLRSSASTGGLEVLDAVTRELEVEDKRWSELVSLSDFPHLLDDWDRLGRDGNAAFGRLVDILDQIVVEDLASVGDRSLARVISSQARSGGEHGFVGSRTSRLLMNAASGAHGVVYDPPAASEKP